MKNLLTARQLRETEAYMIKHQDMSEIELMLDAIDAFVQDFRVEFPDRKARLIVLCGPGHNGGDGLGIAVSLSNWAYNNLTVYISDFHDTLHSEAYDYFLSELIETQSDYTPPFDIVMLDDPAKLDIGQGDILIDALFGTGLNRPLRGQYAALAERINAAEKTVVAVDVPSGFLTEGPIAEPYTGIKADLVITFQRPKLNFLFPESVRAMQDFKVVDIGLSDDFMDALPSDWKWLTIDAMPSLLKKRRPFSHKGTYGHALLLAGSEDRLGAGLLAAQACLKAGAGLITLCTPESGFQAVYSRTPEVMLHPRTPAPSVEQMAACAALGIGPGLGLGAEEMELLSRVLQARRPTVFDADALTLLAQVPEYLAAIPENSILTPHVKEFDRLFGVHASGLDRIETARKIAREKQIVIVLKNRYTFICLPSGEVATNSSGDPAMASGGMGDVLSGILVALLAQGYEAGTAAMAGVFLHGQAGEDLAKKHAVVTASQVADQLPKVWRKALTLKIE